MNIVYNGIEILASSVEVFVLYKIYSILLYKQRGKQNFILDRELACNNRNCINTNLQSCINIFLFYDYIICIIYEYYR